MDVEKSSRGKRDGIWGKRKNFGRARMARVSTTLQGRGPRLAGERLLARQMSDKTFANGKEGPEGEFTKAN